MCVLINLIKDTRPTPSDFTSLSSSLFKKMYLFLAELGLWLWGVGFSLQGLLLVWSTGSGCTDFPSCSAQDQLLHGMWDLPGPGIELVSLPLQGEFLTTGPPGKPSPADLFKDPLSKDSSTSRYLGIRLRHLSREQTRSST